MIKEYTYFCKGTCSRQINYKIDTETNKLVDIEIIAKLENIKCGFKSTSCPDQIAKALKETK